ncbi:GntR family transcriptional regulator [Benzoatithermus flavus]|uniref:GntR family transcriptional regulator n=1 Tax=Benzoatithermus flavus TaxID=3108223 RepID=A0ABU8XZE1_9PROT
MNPLTPRPSLVGQAYEAILDEICEGAIPANTHLVQEALAARLGVSRQPVQQALLLLKNDGVLLDAGRRGLMVAPLDPRTVRHHYQVRAALEALAARLAAGRCAASPAEAARIGRAGEEILAAGEAAVVAGSVREMVARDVEFHRFLYDASGNPVLGPTAQVHWRYLRRVMGEVLRIARQPPATWRQHREILEAVRRGDEEAAANLASRHVEEAASRLTSSLEH